VIVKALRSRLLVSSMIIAVALIFGFLCVQVTSNVLPVEKAYNTESLIRLHILAHSDLPGDQELKLQVRDAIIAETSGLFTQITTREEAWQQLNIHQDTIRQVAEETIHRFGKDYPVEIRLGKHDFPEKTYGQLLVPAGEYQAMQVVIGEGKGKNWWCVLFPPLCFMEGALMEEAIIKRAPDDESQAPRKVVVEWRFRYLNDLYREYGEKLAVLIYSASGGRLFSTAQMPAHILRH
jgi:stage II sporulation protein R